MTKASSRPRTNSPRCLGGASSLRQPNSGAGYLWSEQNAEVANGETNSDVTATGTTGNFSSMAAGQTDSTWDAGVRAVFDLSVDDNNSLADAVDAVVNYLPGYEGNVAKLSTGTTFNNQVYTGQRTKLLVDGIGSNIANLKRIEFEIKLSTIFLGYASNRSDPTVEGNTNLHDYSFQRNGDNDLISINRFSMQTQTTGGFYYGGKIEATSTWVNFYDPSYGVVYDYHKVGNVTAAQAFETSTVGAWGVIEKQGGNGVKPILLLRLPTVGTTQLVAKLQNEE